MTIWGYFSLLMILVLIREICVSPYKTNESYPLETVAWKAIKTLKINRVFLWIIYPVAILMFINGYRWCIPDVPSLPGLMEIFGIPIAFVMVITALHESTRNCLKKCHDIGNYSYDVSAARMLVIDIIIIFQTVFSSLTR